MKKLPLLICICLLLVPTLSACVRQTDSQHTDVVCDTTQASTDAVIIITSDAQTESLPQTSIDANSTSAPTQPSSQSPAVPESTSAASPASNPTEPASSAPTDTFQVKQLNTERDELSIFGNIYIPETQNKKLPAVILSHSANMTSDSMKSYCERIAKMGFVACSFDFCGASPQSRSDGKQADMTVFTEVDDLKAVLKTVKELDYVDAQNIFLFGTSQGGLVSALTAADYPADIKGLILFYPAFNIPDSVQKYAKLTPSDMQSAYISTLLDYDVYEHIKPYQGDVLIVHGTTDFVVPVTYSEKAAEVYENCELHLIPGGTHGFNADNYVSFGDFDRKTWAYAENFLKEHYC